MLGQAAWPLLEEEWIGYASSCGSVESRCAAAEAAIFLDQEKALTMRHYSHLFSCLYDQAEPIGRLGRGTHHSVFRSTQWKAIDGDHLRAPRIHDFAVIWDEDHDERVIRVAEHLHMSGLLWPVVFIGERKGVVTLLLDSMGGPGVFPDEKKWIEKIREVAGKAIAGDDWDVDIGMYERLVVIEEGSQTQPKRIIPDDAARVVPYLQAIDALWLLGDREDAYGVDAL